MTTNTEPSAQTAETPKASACPLSLKPTTTLKSSATGLADSIVDGIAGAYRLNSQEVGSAIGRIVENSVGLTANILQNVREDAAKLTGHAFPKSPEPLVETIQEAPSPDQAPVKAAAHRLAEAIADVVSEARAGDSQKASAAIGGLIEASLSLSQGIFVTLLNEVKENAAMIQKTVSVPSATPAPTADSVTEDLPKEK